MKIIFVCTGNGLLPSINLPCIGLSAFGLGIFLFGAPSRLGALGRCLVGLCPRPGLTVVHKIPEKKEEDAETYLEEVVCAGKEACKEYIKSFLAAIPIRELQADIKKGLNASFHQRLQIEFHYSEPVNEEVVG